MSPKRQMKKLHDTQFLLQQLDERFFVQEQNGKKFKLPKTYSNGQTACHIVTQKLSKFGVYQNLIYFAFMRPLKLVIFSSEIFYIFVFQDQKKKR